MSIDPADIAADINRLFPKDDHDRERDKAKEAEIFKALVQPSPDDVVIEPDDWTNGKRTVADTGEGRHGHTLAASSVRRKRVQWLWEGRIMLGGVNLLVGEGGLGKSMMCVGIAARLSREGGATLIATAEDSPEFTVRPRLEAAQANLDLVHFIKISQDGIEDGLRIPEDVGILEELVAEHGARFLVIDPLVAYLPGEINSWRDQSVRLALRPLQQLAERQMCAVEALIHLNKGMSSDPLRRISGSGGFGNAARSVLLLARDPDDPNGEEGTRRVLAHVKSNVAPLAPSLSYQIKSIVLPARDDFPEVETARIDGAGESSYSGRDLLGSAEGEGEDSAVDQACEFLREELGGLEDLGNVPRRVREVKTAARDAGISERTLERAKAKMGVRSEKVGGRDGFWVWLLRTPPNLALLEGSSQNPHEMGEK
jgi:hypothetical protein